MASMSSVLSVLGSVLLLVLISCTRSTSEQSPASEAVVKAGFYCPPCGRG